jgi:hypothetical protein
MRNVRLVAACAVLAGLPLASCGGGGGGDDDVQPSDAAGLRSFDGGANVIVLTFMAVKATEDRTVLHYPTDAFPSSPSAATLVVPLLVNAGLDPSLRVYVFAGDGVVSEDEWDAGTFFATIDLPATPGVHTVTLDVTTALADALAAGDPFLSFSFRFGGDANLFLGDTVGNIADFSPLPDPTIEFGD